jgi:hypothetical protein
MYQEHLYSLYYRFSIRECELILHSHVLTARTITTEFTLYFEGLGYISTVHLRVESSKTVAQFRLSVSVSVSWSWSCSFFWPSSSTSWRCWWLHICQQGLSRRHHGPVQDNPGPAPNLPENGLSRSEDSLPPRTTTFVLTRLLSCQCWCWFGWYQLVSNDGTDHH